MILQYKKGDRKYRVDIKYCQVALSEEARHTKKEIFKAIADLRRVKKLSTGEQKTLGLIIKDQKRMLDDNSLKPLHTLSIGIGKNLLEYTLSESPNTATIKDGIDELINLMKQKRSERAIIESEEKQLSGIYYETIGGVFNTPGSIITLLKTMNYRERLQTEKKPHPKVKDHHVGIEIEMNMLKNREELDQMFIDNKLTGYVKNKGDGSIESVKGMYPVEVTALFKQKDTNSIVKSICDVIKQAGGKVNNSCGLHVHLDMRNRIASECYTNLFMCLPIINAIVPPNRTKGDWSRRYCSQNLYATLEDHNNIGSRYYAINTHSLREHKTLELRIHSGTVNATKIINFVKLLTMIVDHKVITNKINTLEEFRSEFPEMSGELYDYLIKREDTMKNKVIDTTTDIATDEMYYEVAV